MIFLFIEVRVNRYILRSWWFENRCKLLGHRFDEDRKDLKKYTSYTCRFCVKTVDYNRDKILWWRRKDLKREDWICGGF